MIWLLLDRTIPPALGVELKARGVRSIHASEDDLARADVRALLECAIEDECLLVTRNYGDFSDLSAAYRHANREFPGILFMPADAGSPAQQAERIVAWVSSGAAERASNGCHWLTDAPTP